MRTSIKHLSFQTNIQKNIWRRSSELEFEINKFVSPIRWCTCSVHGYARVHTSISIYLSISLYLSLSLSRSLSLSLLRSFFGPICLFFGPICYFVSLSICSVFAPFALRHRKYNFPKRLLAWEVQKMGGGDPPRRLFWYHFLSFKPLAGPGAKS